MGKLLQCRVAAHCQWVGVPAPPGGLGSQYSPRLIYWPRPVGLRSVWWPRGVLWPKYCLWSVSYFYYATISIFQCFLLIALFSEELEVFLPKYSQTAILHAGHFRWVVRKIPLSGKSKQKSQFMQPKLNGRINEFPKWCLRWTRLYVRHVEQKYMLPFTFTCQS